MEFRPTTDTRVNRLVLRLCERCRLEVGWTDAAVPQPREAGPGNRPPRVPRKRVVAPPPGFTLPELPSA